MTGIPTLLLEKRPGLLDELELADPRLRVVVYYAAAVCVRAFGVVPVLTRVNGTRLETVKFHGEDPRGGRPKLSPHEVRPCRAADLRTRGLLSDEQAQAWEDELDARLEYTAPGAKFGRHTVAYYETQAKELERGRNPQLPPVVPHLHLQVPPWASKVSGPMVRLWTMGAAA